MLLAAAGEAAASPAPASSAAARVVVRARQSNRFREVAFTDMLDRRMDTPSGRKS